MDITYIHNLLITFLFGLTIGALSSIPIGAVQLEVIKKSINGHKHPAIATACGSVSSDLLYGILTLFGFGGFLLDKKFQVIIYSLGIIVISFLFYKALKERSYMLHTNEKISYKKRLSFLTGFTIAITNPGMIIWWLIGFKVFVDLHLFDNVGYEIKALFVISGCLGLGIYLILIAHFLHKMKKSISEKFLMRTNVLLQVFLLILIIYFFIRLIMIVLGKSSLNGIENI